MLGFNFAQDTTTVPDAVVVEVVEQATKAIDTFNSLGVFMAVLLVFSLFVIVILILVWSNRKTGQTALDVVSISNADKVKEVQEMREERRQEIAIERIRQQANHDQFMTALTLLAGKQTEIASGVTSSESRVKEQVVASETNIKGSVAASADANTAGFEKVYKILDTAFQIALARPPDPQAAIKYDQALAVLTTKMEAVKDDLADVKTDVAGKQDTTPALTEVTAADAGASEADSEAA